MSGDRGEKGAFWDDEDKIWAPSPSSATATVAPKRRVALADSAHGSEAAKRQHRQASAAAKDLVKATKQTEASNAAPRSVRSTLNSPSLIRPRVVFHVRHWDGVDHSHDWTNGGQVIKFLKDYRTRLELIPQVGGHDYRIDFGRMIRKNKRTLEALEGCQAGCRDPITESKDCFGDF